MYRTEKRKRVVDCGWWTAGLDDGCGYGAKKVLSKVALTSR